MLIIYSNCSVNCLCKNYIKQLADFFSPHIQYIHFIVHFFFAWMQMQPLLLLLLLVTLLLSADSTFLSHNKFWSQLKLIRKFIFEPFPRCLYVYHMWRVYKFACFSFALVMLCSMCVCVFRVAIRNQPLTSLLQRVNIKNDIPFENICTLNGDARSFVYLLVQKEKEF